MLIYFACYPLYVLAQITQIAGFTGIHNILLDRISFAIVVEIVLFEGVVFLVAICYLKLSVIVKFNIFFADLIALVYQIALHRSKLEISIIVIELVFTVLHAKLLPPRVRLQRVSIYLLIIIVHATSRSFISCY